MSTLSSIVNVARNSYGDKFELRYVHPTLYLICKDESFAELEDYDRQKCFTEKTGLPADIQTVPGLGSAVSLLLATEKERREDFDFLDSITPGQHWLPLLDSTTLSLQTPTASPEPRAIHFYGYKGGQARSTVLAMLSRHFADDGFRVLVVDTDMEAPSLDILFDIAANNSNQTLLGLVNSDQPVEPLSAYKPRIERGKVDLLACRPSSREYDMDFAAFLLRTTLDVTALEDGFKRLQKWVSQENHYDVILFDHRSGLATSILPVVKACPGPVVVCLRIDEQSRNANPIVDILLNQVKDTPGAFVSFTLDPEETREKMLGRHTHQINEMLEKLGSAIKKGSAEPASSEQDLPPEDLISYWISWFHDRAFLNNTLPPMTEISEQNRSSLLQLREVLGLSGKHSLKIPTTPHAKLSKLSPSGAGDEGVFIETQEIARLFQSNTAITYIFGRKGTGKTRLLRELQKRNLGESLVVAADATGGGLPSGDTQFTDLVNASSKDPEKLWWCILAAAIESKSTSEATFRKKLKTWALKIDSKAGLKTAEVAALASALPQKRIFMIDGIETAFRASQLGEFVKALFKFLLTIQSDSLFADKVVVRLFLRTDLARGAIQNVEQQTSGRRLDLTWNTQSIFNFVLSRIEQIKWFRDNFTNACIEINSQKNLIKSGQLPATFYEPLLLLVFPRHIRRNNLQTLTFLKTYFSDAAGDDEARAAFYPRLFDAFLGFIAHPENLAHGAAPKEPIEDGRVHQSLLLAAHEAASRQFLDEVKQELAVLLNLSKSQTENELRVGELLNAFEGLTTPFQLEICLKKLRSKVKNLKEPSLREALSRMKQIGMFEDRPGYSGWWRAGRLFKSALRMKYVR